MAKLKLTVSLSPELIKWVDEQVGMGHFADRSHAVGFSLLKVKELVDKKEIRF